MIYVGANDVGELVFAYFFQNNVYWWHQDTWANYHMLQDHVSLTQDIGDTFTLRRTGTLYTILKNGVDTGINITTAEIPIDINHRLVGFGLYSDDGVGYRTIDSFSARSVGGAGNGFNGSGALSATATAVYPTAGGLSGAGALSVSTSQAYGLTLGFFGSGALTATTTPAVQKAPALSGVGTLSATVSQVYATTSVVVGTGTLSATAVAAYLTTGALAGVGSLSASTGQVYSFTPALSGGGTLSATVMKVGLAAPALSGSGALSATVTAVVPAATALAGSGALSATAVKAAAPGTRGTPVVVGYAVADITLGNSITFNESDLPSLSDGDYLVGVVRGSTSVTSTLATCTGFTMLTPEAYTVAAGGRLIGTYGKPVPTASSEPSTYTFAYTGTAGRMTGMLMVVRGVDPTTPVTGHNPVGNSPNYYSGSGPYTTTVGSLCLSIVSNEVVSPNASSPTPDSDYTSVGDHPSTTGTAATRSCVWVGKTVATSTLAPDSSGTVWASTSSIAYNSVSLQGILAAAGTYPSTSLYPSTTLYPTSS